MKIREVIMTTSGVSPVRTAQRPALATFTGLLAAAAFARRSGRPSRTALRACCCSAASAPSWSTASGADGGRAAAAPGPAPASRCCSRWSCSTPPGWRSPRSRSSSRRPSRSTRCGTPAPRRAMPLARKPFLARSRVALGNLAAVAGVAADRPVCAGLARRRRRGCPALDRHDRLRDRAGVLRRRRRRERRRRHRPRSAGALAETGARLQAAERSGGPADRGWIAALIAVLFAIHVSRMGFDRSALGILSPLVAVLGDIVVALALAYFVMVPLRLFAPPHDAPARARGLAARARCAGPNAASRPGRRT